MEQQAGCFQILKKLFYFLFQLIYKPRIDMNNILRKSDVESAGT